jgi:hypothetical protein
MTVTCPGCKATLTIPDDRLPKGKVVTAACPRCKGPISIDMTGGPSQPVSAPTAAPSPLTPASPSPQAAPAPSAPAPPPTEDAETFQERGQPRALVCIQVPPERQQVAAFLKEQGYAPHLPKDSAEALERLRFTSYAMVVLREGFDGGEEDAPSVRTYLADMGMTARRNIHVVLIHPELTSNDARMAFAQSADLILNPTDLPHFEEALRQSKAENEIRYRVLKETLHAAGKG